MNNIKYGIIIPTYNNAELTIECIESIKKNTKDYCIYWVDDGSEKSNFEKVSDYLNSDISINFISLKKEKNTGFVKSVNIAIKRVLEDNIEYVILLNNDTIINSSGWLDNLCFVLEKDDNIGLVGPLCSGSNQSPRFLTYYDKRFPKDIFKKYKTAETHKEIDEYVQREYKNFYLKTYDRLAFFCVMIRLEVFNDIGLLSEDYGLGYYDDDDFCERSVRSGWDLAIACDTFITHKAEKSFQNKFTKAKWDKIKERLYKKNKDIFEKKFEYGEYEKMIPKENKNELRVRLWRKKKEIQDIQREMDFMKNSKFWRFRNKYLKLKSKIWQDRG